MKSLIKKGLQQIRRVLAWLTVFLLTYLVQGKAQTILTGGEIAFTGYITGTIADTISFIILREGGIAANTAILFTDNGWLATGQGRTGEGIIEWKIDRAVRYGEQVKIWAGSSTVGADKGSLKKVSGNFDLSLSGDQLFAFHGTWPNPTALIAGFHYNRTATTTEAGWDVGIASSGNASVYPAALCTGCGIWLRAVSAAVTEKTIHAYYKGEYDVLPAAFRALLTRNENWETAFTSSVPGSPQWALPPVIANSGNPGEEGPGAEPPHIIAVATSMEQGLYKAGEEVNITAYFDKAVIVNASAGVPFLQLNVGNTTSRAVYVTGSCSSAVTFLYPVQPGDTSSTLDYPSIAAIQLNNGTIQGANAKDADLILPPPGAGASLGAQKIIKVDARPPVIKPFQSFTVDRLAGTGSAIGAVVATDEGPVATTLRDWKIVQGNAGGAFAINELSGEMSVANQDKIAEATPGYALVLTVSDGVNTSQPAEVNILLSELPADTILFQPVDLYENQTAATSAGFLKLKSGSTAAVYSLVAGTGDADNQSFTITGNEILTVAPLNYEVQKVFRIRVRATLSSRSVDTALVINLRDVNEAPTIDDMQNQLLCNNNEMQQLSLSGITGGPEAGQCVTVSAKADKEYFFRQLIVIRETDGTTFLRYRVKEGVSGDVLITITVKDTGGNAHGGVDSVSRSFTITVKAATVVTVVPDRSTELQVGETVLLTASAGSAAGNYQWFLNEVEIPGAREAAYRVDQQHAGIYHCRFTDADHCTHRSNTVLVINKDEPITLLVYPNPAKGMVYLSFSGQLEKYVTVLIYNSGGTEMQRKKIWHATPGQKDEFNIAGYAAGVYIMEIISDKKEKIGNISFIIGS